MCGPQDACAIVAALSKGPSDEKVIRHFCERHCSWFGDVCASQSIRPGRWHLHRSRLPRLSRLRSWLPSLRSWLSGLRSWLPGLRPAFQPTVTPIQATAMAGLITALIGARVDALRVEFIGGTSAGTGNSEREFLALLLGSLIVLSRGAFTYRCIGYFGMALFLSASRSAFSYRQAPFGYASMLAARNAS